MKKFFVFLFLTMAAFTLAACESETETSYADGTYRGVFVDGDEVQVNVQFELEDNVVTSASFRHLAYGGIDYLESDDETIQGVAQQHEDALEHVVGEDVREVLDDLYEPGELDLEDVDDSNTGATIRANKIRSAIVDGLNRGVYSN